MRWRTGGGKRGTNWRKAECGWRGKSYTLCPPNHDHLWKRSRMAMSHSPKTASDPLDKGILATFESFAGNMPNLLLPNLCQGMFISPTRPCSLWTCVIPLYRGDTITILSITDFSKTFCKKGVEGTCHWNFYIQAAPTSYCCSYLLRMENGNILYSVQDNRPLQSISEPGKLNFSQKNSCLTWAGERDFTFILKQHEVYWNGFG